MEWAEDNDEEDIVQELGTDDRVLDRRRAGVERVSKQHSGRGDGKRPARGSSEQGARSEEEERGKNRNE